MKRKGGCGVFLCLLVLVKSGARSKIITSPELQEPVSGEASWTAARSQALAHSSF